MPFQYDQRRRIRNRKRTQQQRIEKTEDRCICPDAKRHDQHNDASEAGSPRQSTHRVSQIPPQVFDHRNSIAFPDPLADHQRISQSYVRLPPGFLRTHAARHVIVDFVLNVRLEFLRQFCILARAPQDSSEIHRKLLLLGSLCTPIDSLGEKAYSTRRSMGSPLEFLCRADAFRPPFSRHHRSRPKSSTTAKGTTLPVKLERARVPLLPTKSPKRI